MTIMKEWNFATQENILIILSYYSLSFNRAKHRLIKYKNHTDEFESLQILSKIYLN